MHFTFCLRRTSPPSASMERVSASESEPMPPFTRRISPPLPFNAKV